MQKYPKILTIVRAISAILAAMYLINIVLNPRWLNPIELFIVSFLIFTAIGQAKEVTVRMLPPVILIMTYEAFRGMANDINTNVSYKWLIDADRALFGEVPTIKLQEWLWQGRAVWYDMLLYLNYMLHFVVPWVLAIIVWKKREKHYWHYISSIILLSYLGFITFLILPSAPPWWASNEGFLQETADIVGAVWGQLGLSSTPEQIQLDIAPNPVAAVPSLHAGYATLVAAYSFRLFRSSKLKYLSAIYFTGIIFGAMYLAQHYFIDLLIGGGYAAASMFIVHRTSFVAKCSKFVRSANRLLVKTIQRS